MSANRADKQTLAANAVRELADRLTEAERLLQDFLDRFYWIKDHPDYFGDVRAFLGSK